jgi:hypothetical protein
MDISKTTFELDGHEFRPFGSAIKVARVEVTTEQFPTPGWVLLAKVAGHSTWMPMQWRQVGQGDWAMVAGTEHMVYGVYVQILESFQNE